MYEYRKLSSEQRAKLVEERLARGFPPHSPPHLARESGTFLITAVCYEHAHRMAAAERRRQVLDLLFEQFISSGVEIRAWAILPNHYHLLVSRDDSKVGAILRLVHGRTAREWNLQDRRAGQKVWFRFTDRMIRSENHYGATLNYIHYNPVKHGCAKSPYDWPESSVHWYLEHFGREWVRNSWEQYPVREYGKGWDDL